MASKLFLLKNGHRVEGPFFSSKSIAKSAARDLIRKHPKSVVQIAKLTNEFKSVVTKTVAVEETDLETL